MSSRHRKEKQKQIANTPRGLNKEQLDVLKQTKYSPVEFVAKVAFLHMELFDEEYDCFSDSIADANLRSQGINPMSEDAIAKVNEKRKLMGVSELSSKTEGQFISSWDFCCRCVLENLEHLSGRVGLD